MNYKFYGCDTVSVTPVNKAYSKIRDQRHLYDLLFDCWCIETCAPRCRKDWSETNRTEGQCSITAFIVQDIFGGEVYGLTSPSGGTHCFNKIGNIVFDLTSEQFGNLKLDYKLDKPQFREIHFQDKEKENRYNLLKKKLFEKIEKL